MHCDWVDGVSSFYLICLRVTLIHGSRGLFDRLRPGSFPFEVFKQAMAKVRYDGSKAW